MTNARRWRWLLLLSLAGYGASLFSRPFACVNGPGLWGYEVLMSGWAGLLALDPRWYANPLMLWMACCALFGWRGRFTLFGAVLCIGLALASVLPALGCAGDPGSMAVSRGLKAGGYLWLVSVVLVAVCAIRPASAGEADRSWPAPAAAAAGAAVHAALRDFREGLRPRTRCPGCTALVLVMEKKDAAPAVPGAMRVTTTCACGACDGSYTLSER